MKELSNKHWESKLQDSFAELVGKLKNNHNIDLDLVTKAFDVARNAHKGQFRASGEPYIFHPLEVAKIIADLRVDTSTIVTALLHDTIEDTTLTYDEISDLFGKKVTEMVLGVTKLKIIENKNTILNKEAKRIENYKNLICAVSKDIMVLLVKLADRLHNMQTLHHIKNPDKRRRIAAETMDIHSALAERIGLHSFKNELQDLAFTELYPQEKKSIQAQLKKLNKNNAGVVEEIVAELNMVVAKAELSFVNISGREKKPCSIWRKIQNKRISFENLSDIFAFRIIVEDVISCYKVLYAIHSTYHMVQSGFKDYISIPKTNGYKSIHTIINGPGGRKIEIQIRTKEMHDIAEFGVAAHWWYKEGLIDREEINRFAGLNSVVSVVNNSPNSIEVLENSKLEMRYHQVFCFSTKDELFSLPIGATPLDFAFYVHSNIGLRCIGAVVNKKVVPLVYELQNGDCVEILCSQEEKASELWEDILVTGKAKTKLKRYLNEKKKRKLTKIGESIYNKALIRLNMSYDRALTYFPLKLPIKYNDINHLFYLLGQEKLKMRDVVKAIYVELEKEKKLDNVVMRFVV